MILAGDIGGTKTRLALFSRENGLLEIKQLAQYESARTSSFPELVHSFLSTHAIDVQTACFGVPGPVQGGRVKVTNLPWELDEETLRADLRISHLKLVNDLVAFTASIPNLRERELEVIYPGTDKIERRMYCVIAPGTGLGMGFLHIVNGIGHLIPSEGGHANFAPNSAIEIELLQYLRKSYSHSTSLERLLCGPGIFNIYKFLVERSGGEERPATRAAMRSENPTAVIAHSALDKSDPICEQALDIFCSVLGSHASNMVLTVLSTGGVYLGGGIPPKILPKLQDGTFVRAYLSKERLGELPTKTPVYVIKDDRAALLGAATLAEQLVRTPATVVLP